MSAIVTDDAEDGTSSGADLPRPVALITGGQGDLATAMAAELKRLGWRVLAPGRAELDVSSGESVSAWFADAPKRLGISRIDALIGNVGVARDGLFVRSDEAAIEEVLAVNLRGAYLCAQAALPLMRAAGGGNMVWIGSWAARNGTMGQSSYAAAKAGLIGLSQSLARELAEENIRSNVVMPGFLLTKMTRNLTPEAVENARSQHVLGRFNTREEAARFIGMLCGMQNVSGQVFQLDSRIGRW